MSTESESRGSAQAVSAGPASLEVRGPGGVLKQVELAPPRLVVGRGADCRVRLRNEAVSRHHAEFFSDPFGRWWVHDLGSRNGTKVNGVPVVERVLGLTDAVEIKPFALRLLPPGAVPRASSVPAERSVTVSVDDFERISTRTELEVARVAASLISRVVEGGRRLLEIEDPEARLKALCEFMVGPELRGKAALAVRLLKGRPDEPPRMLCEPAVSAGSPRGAPYVSRGMLRALRERGEPVLGSNVARSADVELTVTRDELAMSAVACPLRSDEHSMDCLYVLLPPELGTNEWLALTSLAAEEFQKAELVWASRRQAESNAAIEHELEQATEIQMRLIPRDVKIPGLDVAIGFEPCRWVGGDYVDVVPTPDGRVLLTVADVCGKGLQAALVAASLHSMVHVCVGAGVGLQDLMQHLNGHLCGYLPGHSFVTMLAALLDPKTGEMEAANSGHPPAIVLDREGGMRWLQAGANMPLGIGPGDIACHGSRVEPDEMLAMFTDGLTESQTLAHDSTGLEPLARQLCALYTSRGVPEAAAVAEGLSVYANKLHGGGMASDDRTFLLARRVEMPT